MGVTRFRLDEVRRFATALASELGVAPPRAAALAAHLLWFDAAGATSFGIMTLPRWLERIEAGEFATAAEGRVMTERNGTAVLDGQNGLPPLILERAAGLAVEKARDAGVGLVRVIHVGPTGPAAVVAAEMALGPLAAAILGPGPSWSLALPSEEGLPAVFDPALGSASEKRPAPTAWLEGLLPWAAVLTADTGWLVGAVAVAAWEPLLTFHERVKTALGDREARPGQLLPTAWDAHRRVVREQGIALPASATKALTRWAERLGVAIPTPLPR
jgi:Malate/L-lactate dehydrogenase